MGCADVTQAHARGFSDLLSGVFAWQHRACHVGACQFFAF